MRYTIKDRSIGITTIGLLETAAEVQHEMNLQRWASQRARGTRIKRRRSATA